MQCGLGRVLAGVIVILIMSTTQSGCATVQQNVTVTQDTNDTSLWRMSNGKVELIVDSAKGRIMSYGFKGGRNVLWTNAQPEKPEYEIGGWRNFGGEKAWPWPQDYWNWPPPEPRNGYAVQAGKDGASLLMTSEPLARLNVQIVRRIELAKDTSTVVLTTYLKPTGRYGKSMAAWSIAQVPTAPRIFVRIPDVADRQRILNRKPDNFQIRSMGNSVLEFKHAPAGGKIFMDADLFAVPYGDVVFTQRLVSIEGAGPWAPDQRSQIYVHPDDATNIPPGGSYIELEWTAPMAQYDQLTSTPLRVIWKLNRLQKPLSDADMATWLGQLP